MYVRKLFGPPGTGKTTALLRELERELESGVRPERVAFMTFTVTARREAVERVIEKFGFARERLEHFRTVHSASFMQMGVPRSAIVTPDKLKFFAEMANVEFSSAAVGDPQDDVPLAGMILGARAKGDVMMAFDHLRRHRLQHVGEAAVSSSKLGGVRPVDLTYFTKAYVEWKRREGLHDFTDMLARVQHPLDVDVVFIDEAQDLSKLQWAAVDKLAAAADRMYVAGDDDQAIFAWAGADPVHFAKMPCDDAVTLGQSYRVPRRVASVAQAVVNTIRDRQPKKWEPRDEEGEVAWELESKWWEPREGTTFVLARNGYLLNPYEHRLRELGIPYVRQNRPDVMTKWREPIILWERQRKGRVLTEDDEKVVQAARMPSARVDPTAPWFEALDRIPEADMLYLRAVLRRSGNDGLMEAPKVALSTIHAVKGGQADHVVMDARMSPSSRREAHTDGEARVAYVGITRAKKSFTLVGRGHPFINADTLEER